MGDSINAGDTCIITHDIVIEGIVAFCKGEHVVVEKIEPNTQRPSNKYVVFSEKLTKRFQLSGMDVWLTGASPEVSVEAEGVELLDKAMDLVRPVLGPGQIQEFEPKYEQLRNSFNANAILYCLTTFINAEMDCTTPTELGMGRLEEGRLTVPKFGASFRKQLSSLSNDARDEIRAALLDVMLLSYTSCALIMVYNSEYPPVTSARVLMDSWLWALYAELASTIEDIPGARDAVDFMTNPAIMQLESVTGKYKKTAKFSDRKMRRILYYYVVGGFGLRTIEVNTTVLNAIANLYPDDGRGAVMEALLGISRALKASGKNNKLDDTLGKSFYDNLILTESPGRISLSTAAKLFTKDEIERLWLRTW